MTIFVYFDNPYREIIEICSVINYYLSGEYLYYVLDDIDFYQRYIKISGFSLIKVCINGSLLKTIKKYEVIL